MEKSDCNEVESGLQQNALGAVLLQEEECKKSHVTYDSRKLKTSEKADADIEKECLALTWGIQKFHRYIYGTAFIVETDHQPLSYLTKVSKGAKTRNRYNQAPHLTQETSGKVTNSQ